MKRLILMIVFILMALPLAAQTPAPFVPSYFTLAGISYDYYGKTGFAAQTTFGAKITSAENKFPLYSFSTLELTRDIATLRTGAAYAFYQQGNWSLVGLGDAGLATGTGATLGTYSGGGFLAYDVGGKVTKGNSHFYVAFGGRVLNITSQTVQPIFTITFGPGFGPDK